MFFYLRFSLPLIQTFFQITIKFLDLTIVIIDPKWQFGVNSQQFGLNMSLRINDYLAGLFLGIGIRLVDFKVEFGRLFHENGDVQVVLADELSPDNMRLWDAKTNEKMDKDRFRRDLGQIEEAYQEVARRLGILPESGPTDPKGPSTLQ